MEKNKVRLDVLLVERGLAKSRERAKAMVMAGLVVAGGRGDVKPSDLFEPEAEIRLRGDACPYVSRGGLKLEKAVRVFGLGLEGLTCADIGASAGGFTDCMLQNGAARVFAIDVGYGQLDWSLRNDSRVTVMERTNARYLENLGQPVDFASVDVSFISLRLIFPALRAIGAGEAVTLIKPQFEAGREKVGKKGVVRDAAVHREVIQSVIGYAAANGYSLQGLDYSPVKGPNGNIEYIALFRLGGEAVLGGYCRGGGRGPRGAGRVFFYAYFVVYFICKMYNT